MSSETTNTSELTAGTPAGESREWNWHPDLPINTSPVFEKPPRPFASLRWYAGAWLPISELLLYVVIVSQLVDLGGILCCATMFSSRT